MNEFTSFPLEDKDAFTQKLVTYGSLFDTFCILNSCNYYSSHTTNNTAHHDYDLIGGFGVKRVFPFSNNDTFNKLFNFHQENKDWILGYFGYDLKNEIENLFSENPYRADFPDCFFFIPEILVLVKGKEVFIRGEDTHIFKKIMDSRVPSIHHTSCVFQSYLNKEQYVATIETIRNHIIEGDAYELNFCQEFFAEKAEMNPYKVYLEITERYPNPFSIFMKIKEKFILSASMERFLKKERDRLISQPIKGTIKRSLDFEENNVLMRSLAENEKERAENVMIVDLVRNDLSKSSILGSVKVDELCGVYPFTNVNQMISTVSSNIKPDCKFTDAIKNAFPMGSMTGAPKIMAMQLIEKYEHFRRGAFSGAAGYITPDADFDFNVLIRNIFYNASESYISVPVGSAITYDSIAEKEYDECLLKIQGLISLLNKA